MTSVQNQATPPVTEKETITPAPAANAPVLAEVKKDEAACTADTSDKTDCTK